MATHRVLPSCPYIPTLVHFVGDIIIDCFLGICLSMWTEHDERKKCCFLLMVLVPFNQSQKIIGCTQTLPTGLTIASAAKSVHGDRRHWEYEIRNTNRCCWSERKKCCFSVNGSRSNQSEPENNWLHKNSLKKAIRWKKRPHPCWTLSFQLVEQPWRLNTHCLITAWLPTKKCHFSWLNNHGGWTPIAW